jgi:putative FmdB family regulatory protein
MPLYEYECTACGHRFERIQKYSDAPIDACPVCGGAVRKLISSPAFQFKGSGWYVTDYARKDGAKGGSDTASGDTKDKPATTEKKESANEKKESANESRPAKDTPKASTPETK